MPGEILPRSRGLAFKVAVYWLRRRGNVALREVAELAGISAPRVSQIQAEVERTTPDERLAELLRTIR